MIGFTIKLFDIVVFRLSILDSQEILLGIKVNIAELVDDINNYSETKKYPKVYILTLGLIFFNLQIQIQGRE
jgi:hypothetical protein